MKNLATEINDRLYNIYKNEGVEGINSVKDELANYIFHMDCADTLNEAKQLAKEFIGQTIQA